MGRSFAWLYLAGALLLPGRPIYAALYLLGGIYLLARWALRRAANDLVIERHLSDSRVFFGETAEVTLKIKNPSPVPLPWLQVDERRPNPLATGVLSQIVAMGPGEETAYSYQLTGVKRGRYLVGPLSFAAGDPFGFARVEVRREEQAQITVYPRICPLPELGLPARLPMGDLATRRRLFEDPAWLAGTRPYAPGDSMKRIHWTATARTGEMAVKQFRHAMLLPAAICLNLRREEYEGASFWSQSERAITAGASLAQYLVREKQQVGLIAAAAGSEAGPEEVPAGRVVLPLRQGQQAVIDILEALAGMETTTGGPPFPQVLSDQARRMPWGTLLAVITPKETPEMAACCMQLARSGYQILLFVMDGESGRRPGYQCWRISETSRGEVEVG